MLHYSWDRKHGRCNSYILFWAIFCPFTNPKNQNLKKMKRSLEISSFYTCLPKTMITWCTVPDIWCPTEWWMDRWTEKATYRGGCPTTKLGYWLIVLNMKNCGKLKWKTEILKKGKVLICKFCKKLQLLELICEKAKSIHNS